jgi:predicted enzyme related to lactoylglutathione lyase
MNIGEVCLLTNDVRKLADFYKKLLGVDNSSDDDIENEYRKVQTLGVRIIEPPTKRPWGAVNMSFYDPDNNVIYFRQLQEE